MRHALHIYQNTPNGALLFYTTADFLVYFTTVCCSARKYNIKVLGICPMLDHLHNLVEGNSRKMVSAFVRDYTKQYARNLNTTLGLSGAVFNPGFGCSVKSGFKAIRTACSYLYNNPVEKGLCRKPEDYRWVFLAYAVSDHPFSRKIVLSNASRPLRRAIREIDCLRAKDQPTGYAVIHRLFKGLCAEEREQLKDYIISRYNCIDYTSLISFYGSYERMCLAFASNQGSEYDIHESFEPGGHMIYRSISLTIKELGFKNVKDVFCLSASEKGKLARRLLLRTKADEREIRKYLRGTQSSVIQANAHIIPTKSRRDNIGK